MQRVGATAVGQIMTGKGEKEKELTSLPRSHVWSPPAFQPKLRLCTIYVSLIKALLVSMFANR